ncbi:PREDICTED: 12S seed storage protein CRA1-like [Tarenaya hassleriana]|uniref:12S seed storage protein CRA1-like n=1 Tax=Tarenaya hassleriana TaxID=28532 RepID=UPI0008FD8A99|nr:PREDICTED: 12S seed storage protein CRA1-like [Tarenaya hassleriana]
MGKSSSLLSIAITLLLLVHGYRAMEEETNQQKQWQGQWGNECQLDQLNVLEPSHVLKCEAGRIEIWDHHAPQLRCSGVSFDRIVIEPQGLYLPTYFNAPKLSFVVNGRGLMGRVIPGCAETFMDSAGGQWQGQGFRDMHQKVEHLRRGDTIANPAGISQWIHNNGNEPLIIVSVFDIGNNQNQLDRNPRAFHLAGNNPQGQVWLRKSQQEPQNNMFSGFDPQVLAQAFKIKLNTAQQLQNQKDNRGNIVRVQGPFGVIRPPVRGEQRQEQDNGLEETFCTMRCTDNLDDPSRADVYKPQLGYISTLNSYTLPMLRFLRLSALRGSLRNDAMVLPHWNVNANEILYVTNGQAHVQVVNDNGNRVFDQQISKGQLLAIPQGFAVAKTAQSERFEWISFKTNDNAKINTLAGRTSVLRGLPLEVLTNGFQISVEEARRVKFNTLETTLTHSSGQSGRRSDA